MENGLYRDAILLGQASGALPGIRSAVGCFLDFPKGKFHARQSSSTATINE